MTGIARVPDPYASTQPRPPQPPARHRAGPLRRDGPAVPGDTDTHPRKARQKGFDRGRQERLRHRADRQSKVWFTLEGGRVSEVFYPDLSTPSVRSLELTVTDGGQADRQTQDMTTVVTRPDERSLRFTQVSTDRDGHYRLTEEIVTDPARSAVVIRASVESLDGGAHTLGVRYESALGNGAAGDRARSTTARDQGGGPEGEGGQHAAEQPGAVRTRAGERRASPRARPRSAWAWAGRCRAPGGPPSRRSPSRGPPPSGVRRRLARLPRRTQAGPGQRRRDPAAVPRLGARPRRR